jgi:hypothetical protein
MRTQKEISYFLNSLDVKAKYQGSNYLLWPLGLLGADLEEGLRNLSFVLNHYADNQRMLDFGLITGDCISIKHEGTTVILTGDTRYTDSLLLQLFEENGAEILAEGNLLVFDSQGNGEFEVYKNTGGIRRKLEKSSWKRTVRNYSDYLYSERGDPLEFIINLRIKTDLRAEFSTKEEEEGFVEHPNVARLLYHSRGINKYLSLPLREAKEGDSLQDVYPELPHISLLEYVLSYETYSSKELLKRVFEDIGIELQMQNFLKNQNLKL